MAQIGHTARWNECLFLREEPTSIRAATKSEWDPGCVKTFFLPQKLQLGVIHVDATV